MTNQSLDDYLRRVEACPNERLQQEVGIYNNFPILVRATREQIRDVILGSRKYHFEGEHKSMRDEIISAFRSDRSIFNIEEHVNEIDTSTYGGDKTDQEKAVTNEQLTKYSATVKFHWAEKPKEFYEQPGEKILADMALDNRDIGNNVRAVCQLLVKNGLPFCLPKTASMIRDYSIVVYHELDGRRTPK